LRILERARKNISAKVVGEVVSRLLAVLCLIYIARKLGDADFGRYSFAYSFCGLFVVLLDLGLNTLLVRNLARERRETENYLGNITTMKLFLAAIAFGSIDLVIHLLNYPGNVVRLVELMALVTIGTGFLEYLAAAFNSWEKMEYEALLRIVGKIAVFGLGVAVLALGHSLDDLVAVMAVGYLLALSLGFWLLHTRIGPIKLLFDLRLWKHLFRGAIPLGIAVVFTTVYFRVDVVMLSLMRGNDAEIGWYSAGIRIIDTLGAVPFLIMGGLFPILSDLYKRDRKALERIYEKTFLLLFVLGVPVAFGTMALAEKLTCLIYGPEFGPTISALRVLALMVVLVYVNYVLLNLLIAMDKQNVNVVSTGLCVPVNVGLNLLLIPKYGYLGAGAATLATELFLFCLSFYFVCRHFRKLPLFRVVWKPALSGLVMGGGVFYLRGMNIVLLVFLGTVIYALGLFLSRAFSREDLTTIRQVLRMGHAPQFLQK